MAVQHLPPDEALLLQSLHARRDLPALRARVRQLRAEGWTLRAIGEPLSVPRSTVRSWELHPAAPTPTRAPLPPVPSPTLAPSRPTPTLTDAPPRTRVLRPLVPAPDAERIQALAPLARRVRGGTAPNSPNRAAKNQLDALLRSYLDQGVSVQHLATLAGVSYRAMRVRLDTPAHSHHPTHPPHPVAS